MAVGNTFVRLDPANGFTAPLEAPPFTFEPWGGLRYHEGGVFGHAGNGRQGFARYDVATGTWQSLSPVPDGTVLGATIDVWSREFVASGYYGGRNLYRYSLDRGTWTVATVPLFALTDGGLAWMPAPSAGIYFIEGERGTGFARLLTAASFVSFGTPGGLVPGHGAVDVPVRFDATGLGPGTYHAGIVIDNNDPARPVVRDGDPTTNHGP